MWQWDEGTRGFHVVGARRPRLRPDEGMGPVFEQGHGHMEPPPLPHTPAP